MTAMHLPKAPTFSDTTNLFEETQVGKLAGIIVGHWNAVLGAAATGAGYRADIG